MPNLAFRAQSCPPPAGSVGVDLHSLPAESHAIDFARGLPADVSVDDIVSDPLRVARLRWSVAAPAPRSDAANVSRLQWQRARLLVLPLARCSGVDGEDVGRPGLTAGQAPGRALRALHCRRYLGPMPDHSKIAQVAEPTAKPTGAA